MLGRVILLLKISACSLRVLLDLVLLLEDQVVAMVDLLHSFQCKKDLGVSYLCSGHAPWALIIVIHSSWVCP